MKQIITLALSLVIALPAFCTNTSTSMVDEIDQALAELNWLTPGTYKLPQSNSTLALPEGYVGLIGEDLKIAMDLSGDATDVSVEAAVIDTSGQNTIYFQNFAEGYISIDDWKEIDPKAMLETIRNNTEKGNENRRKTLTEELNVIGWVQEPTLDKHTNTVYWTLEADQGNKRIVNSIALRLGRNGFEKLIWVTDKDIYTPFGGELDLMLRSHSFDPGYRYSDHAPGDKIATYGIAALVAATVGAKAVKAASVGSIAILLKKFSVVILAGLTAFFYKIKNFIFGSTSKRITKQ